MYSLVNSAAINMGVELSFQDSDFISFRYIPKKVELLEHMVDLVLLF